jgi:hypothetical protein
MKKQKKPLHIGNYWKVKELRTLRNGCGSDSIIQIQIFTSVNQKTLNASFNNFTATTSKFLKGILGLLEKGTSAFL